CPAIFRKNFRRISYIGFGLLHQGYIYKYESLTDMMIGGQPTQRTYGRGHDSTRFSRPYGTAVRAGAHINCILQCSGNGTVVLRRYDQEAVCTLNLLPKSCPGCRWLLVQVFRV